MTIRSHFRVPRIAVLIRNIFKRKNKEVYERPFRDAAILRSPNGMPTLKRWRLRSRCIMNDRERRNYLSSLSSPCLALSNNQRLLHNHFLLGQTMGEEEERLRR